MKNGTVLHHYSLLKIQENRDVHEKITASFLMGWSGWHAVVPLARSSRTLWFLANCIYSRFRKWIDDGILDNIFRILSLEAELEELSIDASIVQAHQHSAG